MKYTYIIIINLLTTGYLFTQNIKTDKICDLDQLVLETSGLLFYNEYLWTFNDSGGEPTIYQVDIKNGKVLKQKTIKKAKNRDWEAICSDGKYAYIGDFGNNLGIYDIFVIYKIKLSDLNSIKDTISALKIIFEYDPNYYKSKTSNARNFDCEAMIVKNDSIFLFTKNWINDKTYLFKISCNSGKYVAQFVDSLDVGGLITDADFNKETNTIILLGYEKGKNKNSFIIKLSDFKQNIFKAKVEKKYLELIDYQTEGIAFKNKSELFISNEANDMHKQQLRIFKIF